MIHPQWTNRFGILLSGAVLSATLGSAPVTLATTPFVERQATNSRPVPSPIHDETVIVYQGVGKAFTRGLAAVTSTQQGSVWLTPINWQTRAQQEGSEDQSIPPPPSDVPAPPDPEPEPYANVPGPPEPPSDEPRQPGLPPPMPEPAAPHLAPPPPPMPEPAKPPRLSQRPDLNPAHPGLPAPPSPPPSSQADPAAPEPTAARNF